jgi:hypothetical protein
MRWRLLLVKELRGCNAPFHFLLLRLARCCLLQAPTALGQQLCITSAVVPQSSGGKLNPQIHVNGIWRPLEVIRTK